MSSQTPVDRSEAIDLLAARFQFEASTIGNDSPLYAEIGMGIAARRDVLELMLAAPPEQRTPVLLFAAVHYMLLDGAEHRLAEHYPNLSNDQASTDVVEDFADFCFMFSEPLQDLLRTRSTQTNEIGRSAVLEPAYAAVERAAGRPIGLIEGGTSGGLNLRFDRYRLDYGNGILRGDPSSAITLTCSSRSGNDALRALPPAIAPWRVGIDRSPIDVSDVMQAHWLQACVWPDQHERFSRLSAAIAEAVESPTQPTVHAGDLVETLPKVLDDVPDDLEPCLATSWVLSYLDDEERIELVRTLADASRDRPVSLVYAESPLLINGIPVPEHPTGADDRFNAICHLRWTNGDLAARWLAESHPHGRWMTWLA